MLDLSAHIAPTFRYSGSFQIASLASGNRVAVFDGMRMLLVDPHTG